MSLSESTVLANTDQPIIVAELVTDSGIFGIYDLVDIRISKTNRKHFNELALSELAASIKEIGVAQPILIRPVTPTAEEPQKFEIVAGERRYRASIMAGMTTIPAIVKTLSDLQAAKIQIIENLQRENPHPLEEATGYQNLMLAHGYSADQLVTELKRSKAYIYARLKLCSLALDLHEDFIADKFSASTALLIARIPTPALQVKAAKEILEPDYMGQPISYRDAAQLIQNRYMLNLTKATFEIKDAKLLAIAGSCEKCPKRTGNQPEVFTDTDPNICTDPDCFAEKTAALNARKITAANKKGIPVLEGQEATEANVNAMGNRMSGDTVSDEAELWQFERIKENNARMKNVLEILGSKAPPVKFVIKLDSGKVKMIYERVAMQQALEAASACLTLQEYEALQKEDAKSGQTDKYLATQKAQEEKKLQAEKETAFRVALYKRLRQRSFGGFSLQSLREFVKAMVNDYRNDFSLPDDLLGDLYPFEGGSDETVCSYIDQASIEEVQILLVDLVLGDSLSVNTYSLDDIGDEDDQFNTVLAMAKAEDIDPDIVRAELEKPAEQEPAPQPEPVTKPSKRAKAATVVIAGETSPASVEQGAAEPPKRISTNMSIAKRKAKQATAEQSVEAENAVQPDQEQETDKQSPNASWPFPKGK